MFKNILALRELDSKKKSKKEKQMKTEAKQFTREKISFINIYSPE